MPKIGRNDPCPCNSGKKFKKCHGSIDQMERLAKLATELPLIQARMDAERVQRERQQGLGKPIISAEFQGYRVIAVRGKLHYSKNWKTFHDFLLDYVKIVMGKDWWMQEVRKEAADRHTILKWAEKVFEQQRSLINTDGIKSTAMTGAMEAYLNLAYDLYALHHAVEVQELLISRLKNSDNFAGARYEVSVAAKLLRAGFELEHEDETDGSISHVEFTATHKDSGKRFSVEAKQREGARLRLNRLLYRALRKHAAHARMIFIDVNEPDSAKDTFPPRFLVQAEERLRAYERDPVGRDLPPAYVIVTNAPWHHGLDGGEHRWSALVHGFHIPELQRGHAFRSIREAADARDTHIEVHRFMKSLEEHHRIPSTFDGDLPEFAFGEVPHRLVVGNRYVIPANDGSSCEGVLESAIVIEQRSEAACVLRLDDGRRVLCTAPMAAAEIEAWRRHPDTFFGTVDANAGRRPLKTPLDYYDFFYESYRNSSREKLLEFMAGAADAYRLRTLDQAELARLYSERLAADAWARQTRAHTPSG